MARGQNSRRKGALCIEKQISTTANGTSCSIGHELHSRIFIVIAMQSALISPLLAHCRFSRSSKPIEEAPKEKKEPS